MELSAKTRAAWWLVWPGWLLMAALAAWITVDWLRTLAYAVASWGLLPGLLDGVVLLRLGELLILIPLGFHLLVVRRDGHFISRARWVMWAGALLAGFSFLSLNGRIGWAPLALAVAFLGLVLPAFASLKTGCMASIGPPLGLASLILLHLLLQFGGFLLHGYAVVPYPAPYPRPAATAEERLQQDVHYLGSELARLHMNAYHTTSQQAYWDEIARLEAAAPGLSDVDLTLEMMRFVASVGDAHTSFRSHSETPWHALPIDFKWYGNDLHVRGISEAYPLAVGAHVLKIGSKTAEEVYQAVLPYIPHENDAWARVQSNQYLNLVELLVKIGVVEEVGPVILTLENASETAAPETFVLEIFPLKNGEQANNLSAWRVKPYYLSQPDLPFWYEYRPISRSLYFRYTACVDPLGFRKAANEFWKIADEQPVDRLIIDLRGNGGGNTFQFDQFFVPKLNQHPELNDPQRLFVLIDRVTFSSASDHAAFFRKNSKATLVGEPTGGRPNGYGEVRSFTLPNSRAEVRYSTNYFQPLEIDLPSLEPDVLIYAPAEEAFAGEDPVLEYVVPEEDW
jgi:Peptidase family S41